MEMNSKCIKLLTVYHIQIRYPDYWNELYFRDYLISHPKTAAEYVAMKRKLHKNMLLTTKKHRLDLDELTDEESGRIMKVSKLLLTALRETYNFDGYSIMQNGGVFNDVGHYHYHIFPRYKDDGFAWIRNSFSPKNVAYEGVKLKTKITELIKSMVS